MLMLIQLYSWTVGVLLGIEPSLTVQHIPILDSQGSVISYVGSSLIGYILLARLLQFDAALYAFTLLSGT